MPTIHFHFSCPQPVTNHPTAPPTRVKGQVCSLFKTKKIMPRAKLGLHPHPHPENIVILLYYNLLIRYYYKLYYKPYYIISHIIFSFFAPTPNYRMDRTRDSGFVIRATDVSHSKFKMVPNWLAKAVFLKDQVPSVRRYFWLCEIPALASEKRRVFC